MLRFVVLKKMGRQIESLYSANELALARKFYTREKESLKQQGCKVYENKSFTDKPSIPFEGNIYMGDIESLSFTGHEGSGFMAIKVFNDLTI